MRKGTYKRNPLRSRLCAWLDEIVKNPPPAEIHGLYFGLFQAEEGYGVYLTGARDINPDDDGWLREENWAPGDGLRYCGQKLAPADMGGREVGPGRAAELYAQELRQLAGGEGYEALFKGRTAAAGFDDGALEPLL